MTHLISLEQFRGWLRLYAENSEGHGSTPKSVLTCLPVDDDSIESRWITWDEAQCLYKRKQSGCSKLPSIQSMGDSWLSGHKLITFFRLLDCY